MRKKEMLDDLKKIKDLDKKYLEENILNFLEKYDEEIHPEDVAKREHDFLQEHPDYDHESPEHRKIYTDNMLVFIEFKIKIMN